MFSEKYIQNQCIDYLDLLERRNLVYGARTQVIRTKTIRRDGSQGYLKTGKVGLPDWTGCVAPYGQFVGIEFKTDKGKQSEHQKLAQARIEAVGGKYIIVRSINELVQKLDEIMKPD